MVAVQADGCAPIVNAFHQGFDRGAAIDQPHTIADGLRVPAAVGDFLMLRILRASGGAALAVNDEAMIAAMRRLGSQEGVSAAPEGGAALAAIERLVQSGAIGTADTVVLFNTGGALKYLDLLESGT
jgi:threonine synthase